ARWIVSAQAAGSSPKPFSRSAETGSGVASTIARAFLSVSSRLTAPSESGLPSENAKPALVVASASKPSDANSLADPASHAFGTTNRPGLSCRCRNRSARARCVSDIVGACTRLFQLDLAVEHDIDAQAGDDERRLHRKRFAAADRAVGQEFAYGLLDLVLR